MSFPISAGLLDALVLAVVSKEDTYGYKITQEMSAQKPTIWNLWEETGGTTELRQKGTVN